MTEKNINEKSILLIEDNPNDVDMILRVFNKNNITNKIIILSDGAEALNYCKESVLEKNKICPIFIILDLKLPKVDGIEVLKFLRANERTKFIPVVVLTSSQEEKDLLDSYKFGANSFIHKPVDFDKFVEAVRELGLYWLLLNEPVFPYE